MFAINKRQPYCFDKNSFENEKFDAGAFLISCRKRATLETIGVDLNIFLKELKDELGDLVNQEYVGFLSLSTKLEGVEEFLSLMKDSTRFLKSDITVWFAVCMADPLLTRL